MISDPLDVKELQAEYQSIKKQYQTAAAMAVLVLSGGSIFYHLVERLSWLNAIYFSTITLTTVGYGDITPKTPAGKLFTIMYVFVGIGTIGFFANLLIKNTYLRRELKRARRKSSLVGPTEANS